jgi:hypothetical protein
MKASHWQEYKHEDCPACGSRGWCCYDEDDPGLFVMCMRSAATEHPGFLFSRMNADGATAYFVRVEGDDGYRPSPNGRYSNNGVQSPIEPAGPDVRNRAYETLLGVLNLTTTHSTALAQRGLSGDQIYAGRYRTLPPTRRRDIAEEVRGRSGLDTETLLKVPGFARDDHGQIELVGRPGLLIPVTDGTGSIVGLQLRPDDPGAGGKYVWLSSGYRGGAKAVVQAHSPPVAGADRPRDLVRLTEGPLKANVATANDGLFTIGITGCGLWKKALPTLEALGVRTVRIAFDADVTTNPQVCGGLCNALRGLVAAGYAVEVEHWDVAVGKGIDDVLAGGGRTKVSAGLDAIRFVLLAANCTKIDAAPVTSEEVAPWVEWYLSRKLAVELSQDKELMKAAGRLKKLDPGRWTELIAVVKRHPRLIRGAEWLRACEAIARPPVKQHGNGLPYYEADGCTYSVGFDAEGQPDDQLLANFTARIACEIHRHEPGGVRKQFEIRATTATGTPATLAVDAGDYAECRWPELMGSAFIVTKGRGTRDALREAVCLLSHDQGPVPIADVFVSLGWHDHGGTPVYCHAGGVIGPDGPVSGVEVSVNDRVREYRLPEPTDDIGVLRECFASHLRLYDSGNPETKGGRSLRAILETLPARAVFGVSRTTVHLSGSTGIFKSCLAMLLHQHVAAGAKGRPGKPAESWDSTDMTLIAMTYYVGDSLLWIDDFKRAVDLTKVERVVQAIGDGKGRGRMGRDQSLREDLSPRGSVVSTGEEDPQTASALARCLILKLAPGDVRMDVLAALQDIAEADHFAILTATYVRHLAANRKTLLAEFDRIKTNQVRKLRKLGAIRGAHARHADAVAELIAAYQLFLRWARDRGLITHDDGNRRLNAIKADLIELAGLQADPQAEAKPGRRFLDLICAYCSMGSGYIANFDIGGMKPVKYADECGWKTDFEPTGVKRLGWISNNNNQVYLDPEACKYAVAEMLRSDPRRPSFNQIGQHLLQEGLAVAASDGRPTRNIRISDCQKRCLVIPLATMFPGDPAPEPLSEPGEIDHL